jgi:hypothetical protein
MILQAEQQNNTGELNHEFRHKTTVLVNELHRKPRMDLQHKETVPQSRHVRHSDERKIE